MGAENQPCGQSELEITQEMLQVSERQLAIATEALRKSEERAVAGRLALEVMHEVQNPLEALGHLTYLALMEADDPALWGKGTPDASTVLWSESASDAASTAGFAK